jgi:[protein-PII] uridylyltransferase
MQFDMYHHYTVDEHSIRAIGLLSRIERGEYKEEHKLGTALFQLIASRRVLYVAVLLHDIAKGRGGDHSLLGAEVALALCPRLGLTPAETETVAWLVRFHLLMSITSQRRDLSDPETIRDFTREVKSLERLRLLYLLTVVDISAVGPGTWNSWKRQLLGVLFEGAEEVLRLGHKEQGRKERVAAIQDELGARLGWKAGRFARYAHRFADSYWLAEPVEVLEQNALFAESPEGIGGPVAAIVQKERGATLVTLYTRDQPGLFYRVAGAISLAGGNIIDARIHTTGDGMALDNLLVQDGERRPFSDPHRLQRLKKAVDEAVHGREPAAGALEAKALPLRRAEAFTVAPAVFLDNKASSRFTVVEVNARDRAALLSRLAKAIFDEQATIRSAHIATFGERAVDVFYLMDSAGGKIDDPARLKALHDRLVLAAGASPGEGRKAA